MSNSGLLAVGADAGGGPHVRVFEAATGEERASFFAYDAGFAGGVRVGVGNLRNTSVPIVVTAPGPGGGPHVRVFSLTNDPQLQWEFFAYDPAFTGGVQIALGDFDADGYTDIATGAGAGGGPHVRVLSGRTRAPLFDFFAFDPGFRGGVNVAAGDVDGDGHADVIVGAGPGGGPHVRVISGKTHAEIEGPLGSFFAYTPHFTGGVHVAAGDLGRTGLSDVVTGPGAGGGPHLKVFAAVDGNVRETLAYDAAFSGGVRVGVADADGDGAAEIITAPGPGGGPHIRAFDGASLTALDDFFAFDANFRGGAFAGGAVFRSLGQSNGTFSNASPTSATYTLDANSAIWGVPGQDAEFPGQNIMWYFGQSFASTSNDMDLGTLVLRNFETELGTELHGVDLNADITLDSAAGPVTQTVTIPLQILSTPNDGTPAENADSILFPSDFPTLRFEMPDGGLRVVDILGFYDAEGQKVDEFVVREGRTRTISLRARLDLAVNFKDSSLGTLAILPDLYGPGAWSTAEKQTVREALEFMIDHTGTTAILKPRIAGRLSNQLTFVRVGNRLSGGGTHAINGDEGIIYVMNRALEHGHDLLRTTILHELGHHWDESFENPHYAQFLIASDWKANVAGLPSGYAVSGNGQWIYISSANFVSDYAKESPREDFAETFGVYFASAWGKNYYDGSGMFQSASTLAARAPAKVDIVAQLVIDLAAL